MAKIELRLSPKVQSETGMAEVLITLRATGKDLYAKSGIYIKPDYFEYFLDRKKTKSPRVALPINKNTATTAKAEKNGWALRKCGVIAFPARAMNQDIKYHVAQNQRLEDLKQTIINAFNSASTQTTLSSEWLAGVVDNFHNPDKTNPVAKRDFYALAEEYLTSPHDHEPLAENHARVYRVMVRAAARYEGFVNMTQPSRKGWAWDIHTVTKADVEDFADYLKNEKELAEDYTAIFEHLTNNYPANVQKGRNVIEPRGRNTVIKMLTRLKTLFKYFNEQGYTTNNPFNGMKIGTEKVGEPIYITGAERDQIAEADLAAIWSTMTREERKAARMPLETLIQQRDIFVFHCFVGCRVGDLIQLTEKQIHNGVLVYTPHKTKDTGEQQATARVPLHRRALGLIEKYRGVDAHGRLFPFITPQRYNDAIKCFFRMAGVTRNVIVRNALTGENEVRPINEIAASHMARRTFIGNAYFKVQDPNLIGKMSGHVEGSEAFSRYRKIEDKTLKDVINQL